jgi:hypothetical protein
MVFEHIPFTLRIDKPGTHAQKAGGTGGTEPSGYYGGAGKFHISEGSTGVKGHVMSFSGVVGRAIGC